MAIIGNIAITTFAIVFAICPHGLVRRALILCRFTIARLELEEQRAEHERRVLSRQVWRHLLTVSHEANPLRPNCIGPYALDSFLIFHRDVLGLATYWDGLGLRARVEEGGSAR